MLVHFRQSATCAVYLDRSQYRSVGYVTAYSKCAGRIVFVLSHSQPSTRHKLPFAFHRLIHVRGSEPDRRRDMAKRTSFHKANDAGVQQKIVFIPIDRHGFLVR